MKKKTSVLHRGHKEFIGVHKKGERRGRRQPGKAVVGQKSRLSFGGRGSGHCNIPAAQESAGQPGGNRRGTRFENDGKAR